MAANISFLVGEGYAIQDLSGSGLGFYGDDGFGASVRVGEWQGRTFVTNSTGTTLGVEADNVKYLNIGSGILGQDGSGIALTCIPNAQCTVMPEFTYDSAVQVQNTKLYFYDRVSVNNAPSGVTVKAAEIIHPDLTQANNGSGDTTWYTPAGSGVVVPLANSPGVSGLWAGNGTNSTRPDTTHRWHVALSCSPDTIGAKYFGMFLETEFL